MKISLLAAVGAVALMSGCASTGPQSATAYDDNIDYRTVAAINTVARQRGVQVEWINYPQKSSRKRAPEVTPALGAPTGT